MRKVGVIATTALLVLVLSLLAKSLYTAGADTRVMSRDQAAATWRLVYHGTLEQIIDADLPDYVVLGEYGGRQTIIGEAARKKIDTERVIRYFAARGVDLNKGDYKGRPPIENAISSYNLDAFKTLLDLGANSSWEYDSGYSKSVESMCGYLTQTNPSRIKPICDYYFELKSREDK